VATSFFPLTWIKKIWLVMDCVTGEKAGKCVSAVSFEVLVDLSVLFSG
jgi:hypothetical protein